MLKITLKCIVGLAVGLVLLGAQIAFTGEASPPRASSRASPGEAPILKTQKDRQSYAVGVDLERNFKRQGFDLDLDIVIRGMKDAQAGDKFLLTEAELLETLNVFASDLRRKKAVDRLMAAQDNKKEGEAFLAENKTKEGVVTLPSGLQHRILKAGEGKKPMEADTVVINYRGTLVNGTQFESTDDAGHPAKIKISDPQIIPGLREALKLMPVGSKWQLFIPSQLAYGQRGSGQIIGPYATLVFEIELDSIK
jgi:FKBP-type peptidyl-prolyl cis-trans isomerase FklB